MALPAPTRLLKPSVPGSLRFMDDLKEHLPCFVRPQWAWCLSLTLRRVVPWLRNLSATAIGLIGIVCRAPPGFVLIRLERLFHSWLAYTGPPTLYLVS